MQPVKAGSLFGWSLSIPNTVGGVVVTLIGAAFKSPLGADGFWSWVPLGIGIALLVSGLRFDSGYRGSFPPLWMRPRIKISAAARLAYERTEGKFVGEIVDGLYSEAARRISYFHNSMIVNRVPIFGEKPPSTVPRPLPADEVYSNLKLRDGTDDLEEIFGDALAYRNCYVRGWRLARMIKHVGSIKSV